MSRPRPRAQDTGGQKVGRVLCSCAGILDRVHVVLLIGPPAVGKMTVGREICVQTGYRLLHNHHTIEPLLEIFGYGTRAFDLLNQEFRQRIFEEAVRDDLPGLVFAFVWDLDEPATLSALERLFAPAVDAGGPVDVVQLLADQDTRLSREGTAARVASKPSKRDVAWARNHLREVDERHRFVIDESDPVPWPVHTVENGAERTARDTAAEIIRALGLPRRVDGTAAERELR